MIFQWLAPTFKHRSRAEPIIEHCDFVRCDECYRPEDIFCPQWCTRQTPRKVGREKD